jgi:hypothetical protein
VTYLDVNAGARLHFDLVGPGDILLEGITLEGINLRPHTVQYQQSRTGVFTFGEDAYAFLSELFQAIKAGAALVPIVVPVTVGSLMQIDPANKPVQLDKPVASSDSQPTRSSSDDLEGDCLHHPGSLIHHYFRAVPATPNPGPHGPTMNHSKHNKA